MGLHKGQTNNPSGRKKGSKNKKTEQWEALADSITGEQSQKFSEYMDSLWKNEGKDPDQARKDRYTAADLYLKTLEYFKPKQSRVEGSFDKDTELVVRIIKE